MKKYFILLALALAGAVYAQTPPVATPPPLHPVTSPTIKPDPMADLTKERDSLKSELAALRQQLAESKHEAAVLKMRLNVIVAQRDEANNQLVVANADLALARQQANK